MCVCAFCGFRLGIAVTLILLYGFCPLFSTVLQRYTKLNEPILCVFGCPGGGRGGGRWAQVPLLHAMPPPCRHKSYSVTFASPERHFRWIPGRRSRHKSGCVTVEYGLPTLSAGRFQKTCLPSSQFSCTIHLYGVTLQSGSPFPLRFENVLFTEIINVVHRFSCRYHWK